MNSQCKKQQPFLGSFILSVFHEKSISRSIFETWWIINLCGKMLCCDHACALWKNVHFLCFNKPFLEEGQCLKAGECALWFREMKRHSLCFLLCIICAVLGHILTKGCTWFFGRWLKVSFPKWDSSFLLFQTLRCDKWITYCCGITKFKVSYRLTKQ